MSDFNIDFTKRDYLSLLSAADAYAKSILPEWTSRDDNDINWATIKIVAYLISIGMFYIDLGVNKQDPYEVQIYKNALRLARRYGYLPMKATGAIGLVEVTIATHAMVTVLPRGATTFSDSSGNTFVLVEDATFASGVNFAAVTVRYGSWNRYVIGVSDGTEFQKFTDTTADVQNRNIRVFVDEGSGYEEWSIEDTLLMSEAADKHARLVLTEDEYYEIHFGDSQAGKIPPNGATIDFEVIYLPSGYASVYYGNLASGNITVCSDVNIVSVAQSSAIQGGVTRESTEEIGRNLPQWIATSEKCIGISDYEFLARRVAGVAVAQATTTGFYTYVYITPVGGGVPNAALLGAVEDYLSPRCIDQVILDVIAPTYQGVYAMVSIVAEDTYSRAAAIANASVALASYFNDSGGVGYSLYLMEAYNRLKDVEGIKSAIINVMITTGTVGVGDLAFPVNISAISSIITVTGTGGLV